MRLHIIGIPSAGKTTLANDISRLLGVPCHDLDSLIFVDERWSLRPISDRDAMVARILEEPSFVTEGGFLGWTDGLLSAADHIVWLDPPLVVLIWRHVRRHWRKSVVAALTPTVSGAHVSPTGWGWSSQVRPHQTRTGIKRALRPWTFKVYRVTRGIAAADVIKWLALSQAPR